jgi:phosphoserine/homoserine phosphotransferase
MLFAIDLEGVLAPELWPLLGERLRVPELSLTTRDTGDFQALMARRLDAVRKRGLGLADLQAVTHAADPEPGAREFLARLRGLGQVIVISDTFHELAEPLVQRLGGHSLFANRFEVGPDGELRGFRLRIRGQKERIVSGLKSAGFRVGAMGDSLNDLSLLLSSDFAVLYRPVAALRSEYPGIPVAEDLDQAYALFERAHAALDNL